MFQEDIALVEEMARKIAKEEIAKAMQPKTNVAPELEKVEVKAEVEPVKKSNR